MASSSPTSISTASPSASAITLPSTTCRFAVAPGEFFSILGPSGCGKTTLLRMIAGFEEPDAGDDPHPRPLRCSACRPTAGPVNMVFQSLALFPMMSVGENVAYGLRCRGVGTAEAAERTRAMLERVGLPGFADRRVDDLSGGQRQRVAIARCLVLEPTLVLLDEPLGALDLKLREHMKIELKQLQATFGTTFVYITHDQSEALVMSDRVAVMNAGPLRAGRHAARALPPAPRRRFVAGFVGETNQLARARSHGAEPSARRRCAFRAAASSTGMGAVDGRRAAAFVRPEAIALATDRGRLAGPAEPLRRPRLGGAVRRRELGAAHR